MDDTYYLSDYGATELYHQLDKFHTELLKMAENDSKSTVGAWWAICRIREIKQSVFWGFGSSEKKELLSSEMELPEEAELPFPDVQEEIELPFPDDDPQND